MPELQPVDVENYTQGRLHRDDAETIRLLAAGLSAARRFCGWHVTPVMADSVQVLDGPGGRLLALPTLELVALTAISENSTALTVSDLDISGRGMVMKRSGGCWTDRLGGISVTMTHGFAAAPDFDAAVLSYIDRSSLGATVGGQARVIGPFQYDTEKSATGSAFSDAERSLLEQYRLERAA